MTPFRRTRVVSGALSLALPLALSILVSGCSSKDTRSVDTTTTTRASSITSAPSNDDPYEGVVQTLMKMGIGEEQARCVVDRMDRLSSGAGEPSATDRTQIEKLLEECKVVG